MMKTFGNKIFGKLTLFFTIVFCFALAGMMLTPQTTFAASTITPSSVGVDGNKLFTTDQFYYVNGDENTCSLAGLGEREWNAYLDVANATLYLKDYNAGAISFGNFSSDTNFIISCEGTNTITSAFTYGLGYYSSSGGVFGSLEIKSKASTAATLNINVESGEAAKVSAIMLAQDQNKTTALMISGNLNLNLNAKCTNTDEITNPLMGSAYGIYMSQSISNSAKTKVLVKDSASLTIGLSVAHAS